ncbi:CPBP family intramembrane glutamic endopeptidase [Lysinibacillus irui]|uniref:CPBP family intramembrane glutamic endopeptidase n=1 Tax=Lysinibacillus irui TaxID=2998077 RepID=A0ABU5NH72_9BACI|nr:CPBP family intramembrane glutamic endopeptidase [Lysinibacillus irui]MEA0552796.1 CPBP family intramembrane glutamic endopeptidase [Lysinibacillus irui]MEA0975376.1 CPBP family intramembrane glutamic endopeptidase [Lysinibacillus irui]MEA1041530.1 CPBP family intramembrane glutamic endopeptidase [Lysinibacillus irui]
MENKKIIKKEANPKDAIVVFTSFSFICLAIMFMLIVYEVVNIEQYLTFNHPAQLFMYVIIASFALVLYGVILTYVVPSNDIDDTNKSYQMYSLHEIFAFMLLGAVFEELLFRGIIQNVLYIWLDHQWMAILITTCLFLAIHVQYFKKPIMLLNISIPSLTFSWLYFNTYNILVPIIVHFLMNLGITLLFKYNVLRVKKSN